VSNIIIFLNRNVRKVNLKLKEIIIIFYFLKDIFHMKKDDDR